MDDQVIGNSQILLETPRFEVVKDIVGDGNVYNIYYYIRKKDAVGIIVKFQDKICLVKTKRHLIEQSSYELFGGRIENDENPLLAAQRELYEELGVNSSKWHYIMDTYPLPSVTTECLHIFMAEINDLSTHKLETSEGLLEIKLFSKDEIRLLLQKNRITGASDAYALLYYITFH